MSLELEDPIAIVPERSVDSALAVDVRPATLLVIEDHADSNRLLSIRFRNLGVRVVCAYDGVQGFSRAIRDRPDVIILDLGLPRMNGVDLLRRFRFDERTKRMPIIVLTGRRDIELFDSLHGMVRRLFFKPTSSLKLVEAVQSILNDS